MKRKLLAAMVLAVSVSAVPVTAYASSAVSDSASVNAESQTERETAEPEATPAQESAAEADSEAEAAESEKTQTSVYEAGWNSVEAEGKTYWFFYDAEAEAPKTGLFTEGGKTYLGAAETGYLLTGAQTCTDESGTAHAYYFSEDGEQPGADSSYGTQVAGFAADGKYYEPELAKNKSFEVDGATYYAGEDGTIVKDSFADVDGKTCYFDKDGKQYTTEGWITVQDETYYIMDGAVCKDGNYESTDQENSWLILDGEWYLLDRNDGHRLTGLQKNENDLYYLDPEQDGRMFTSTNQDDGWKQLNGTWYFFRSWGGALNNGWNKLENDWYWFNEDCTMASAQWIDDGENLYYVRDWGGMMHDQWLQKDGIWYYFRSWGGALNNGWNKLENDWYWFNVDGTMASAQCIDDGENLYYVRDWGGMMHDQWLQKDGIWYYFRSWGGALNNGWNKLGNDWYWFNSDCKMAANQWLQQGNDWYYLRSWGGRLHDQWYKIENDWYYFGNDGRMLHDQWLKNGNDWYYLRSWGGMMHDQWYTENGKTYYFRSWGGRCHSGAFVIDGETYYFNSDGVLTDRNELSQVIVIDPGHQGQGDSRKEPIGPGSSIMKARVTSGTTGCVSGLDEYELNLQVSLLLRTELESRGYTVYMTRETHDVNISNKERAEYAASVGGDILVRIHANGDDNSSVNGALCMAPSDSNPFVSALAPESQRLSQCIIDSYCQSTGLRNRGVSITDDMSGINWATMPVTIVEMGFMSNAGDDSKMADGNFQKKMVEGIADGIDQYFQ